MPATIIHETIATKSLSVGKNILILQFLRVYNEENMMLTETWLFRRENTYKGIASELSI